MAEIKVENDKDSKKPRHAITFDKEAIAIMRAPWSRKESNIIYILTFLASCTTNGPLRPGSHEAGRNRLCFGPAGDKTTPADGDTILARSGLKYSEQQGPVITRLRIWIPVQNQTMRTRVGRCVRRYGHFEQKRYGELYHDGVQ